MKTHWFHILLALADGARHGAEIRRKAVDNYGETLELHPPCCTDRSRTLCNGTCYKLTKSGRQALERETKRLESLTRGRTWGALAGLGSMKSRRDRFYEWLLRLYPYSFRLRHQDEMRALFAEMKREAGAAGGARLYWASSLTHFPERRMNG